MENIEFIWESVKTKLKEKYDENTFNEHFGAILSVHKFSNGFLYLIVTNDFAKYRLLKFYQKEMNDILETLVDEKCSFEFITKDEIEKLKKEKEENSFTTPNSKEKYVTQRVLRPEYTFENFVPGEANREAFTIAVKVATSPTYANPLYIFGDVGLGKTHLMVAIGHTVLKNNINANVIYTTAQQFVEDYFNSKNKNQKSTEAAERFNNYYRSADLLLVDDIQFLAGKTGSQEEFFKLFEILYENNKQIVITSDRPAEELDNIMPRLRSRFAWGIPVDVRKPNFELRKSILKLKVKYIYNEPEMVSEEVFDYIAENFEQNVRELEGALRRVVAYCVSFSLPINKENAVLALSSLIKVDKNAPDEQSENIVIQLKEATASYFNIKVTELDSASRRQDLVYARNIIIYILRTKYNFPLKKIGSYFGGRDHATIAHAVNKIEQLLSEENSFTKQDIDNILKKLEKKSE